MRPLDEILAASATSIARRRLPHSPVTLLPLHWRRWQIGATPAAYYYIRRATTARALRFHCQRRRTAAISMLSGAHLRSFTISATSAAAGQVSYRYRFAPPFTYRQSRPALSTPNRAPGGGAFAGILCSPLRRAAGLITGAILLNFIFAPAPIWRC